MGLSRWKKIFTNFFSGINIFKLKKQIEKLKKEKEKYRSVFEGVNDGIYIHDAKTGRILDFNQRACAMFGYTRAEILKKDQIAI